MLNGHPSGGTHLRGPNLPGVDSTRKSIQIDTGSGSLGLATDAVEPLGSVVTARVRQRRLEIAGILTQVCSTQVVRIRSYKLGVA